jgi:hypothetical protein
MEKHDIKRWGILYCGGAANVVKALEKTGEDLCVSFIAESFAW